MKDTEVAQRREMCWKDPSNVENDLTFVNGTNIHRK